MEAQADRLPLGEIEQPQRETKEEAFVRMATPRVEKALDSIRLVGNLSNRGSYEFNEADVAAIMMALRTALNDVESRFRVNSPRPGFQLRR